MAKINVNLDTIEDAAASVDRYVQSHRRHMQQMEQELLLLKSQWGGSDYQQVLLQWQQLDADNSASGLLIRDLENQAKMMRWAVQRYETVRNQAISRAKRLIR